VHRKVPESVGAKVPTSRTLVPHCSTAQRPLAGLAELLVMLGVLAKLSVSGEVGRALSLRRVP
jgi:hypothetical protein